MAPYIRKFMSPSTAFFIFLKNVSLATLICYGGVVFALVELWISKFQRVYKVLEKGVRPLYAIMAKFQPEYAKLTPVWKTCNFSISFFSTGCIFLIFVLISLYFTLFLLFGLGLELLKFIPHLTLEVSTFIVSANAALATAKELKLLILKEEESTFIEKCKSSLTDKSTWKKLLTCYVILFFAAFVEMIVSYL